jgi:hypothetical protein
MDYTVAAVGLQRYIPIRVIPGFVSSAFQSTQFPNPQCPEKVQFPSPITSMCRKRMSGTIRHNEGIIGNSDLVFLWALTLGIWVF